MTEKKINLVLAHPDLGNSTVNKNLIAGIENFRNVTINDLYKKYPDFNIDVIKEQRLLSENDIIILQHPFYWYSAPALLKQWMDKVLLRGWAYGKNGEALRGKIIFNAISTGGPKSAYSDDGYNKYSVNQFLTPYKQSAALCKMIYLPPFVIHGARMLTEEQLLQSRIEYHNLLRIITNIDQQIDEISGFEYLNDFVSENFPIGI